MAIEAFLRSPAATHASAAQGQEVEVISGFRNAHGQSCRVVQQTVIIAGQNVHATGTMCQEANGSWTLSQ